MNVQKSFFQKHRSKFDLEGKKGEKGLRKCQLGATWALKSHYTQSNDPALISLPTGAGKTALMITVCFEFEIDKVLIITPSKIIRNQIAKEFENYEILKTIGVISNELDKKIKVKNIKKMTKTKEEWKQIFHEHDVVVATPNTTSPAIKNVLPVPEDLIDLLILDEAHHEPAESWNAINNYYENTKNILLTATPFRRDKQRIDAQLVYHYFISNAIEDEIFRPVKFEPITKDLDTHSNDFIQEAVSIYKLERESNPSAKMIIRTDQIENAETLKMKYNEYDLNVECIHSKKTDKQNKKTLEKLENGEIEAIVTVSMMGEGLDIPEIKIAVLHVIPKTLPYTIQFIGRISRYVEQQEGKAILIADPRKVEGEVTKLYKKDEGWDKLIPDIIDERVSKSSFMREADFLNDFDIDISDIKPYFSVAIKKASEVIEYNPEFKKNLPYDIKIKYVEQENNNTPLVIVTETNKNIHWAYNISTPQKDLDLHIYYFNEKLNLLFEYTTREKISKKIKEYLIDVDLEKISDSELISAISEADGDDYYMLGLRNTIGNGYSNPNYKTLLGSKVQAAIRLSDGRTFAPGHALVKINEDETRGIGGNNGKVWANMQGSIEEFRVWCDQIAASLDLEAEEAYLPKINFLAKTKKVYALEQKPIGVLINNIIFKTLNNTFEVNGESVENIIPKIKMKEFDEEQGVLQCKMHLTEELDGIDLEFQISGDKYWKKISSHSVNLVIDIGKEEKFDNDLESFLEKYPPSLVMPDSSTIINNNKYSPQHGIEKLPQNIFKQKDWDNCDIRTEAKVANDNKVNVLEATLQKLKENLNSDEDIIFSDDGSGEISDLIVFKNSDNRKEIIFVHCKYSSEDYSGNRLKDANELFIQGVRSLFWLRSPSLLEQIVYRKEETNSSLVFGKEQKLLSLKENFNTNEWNYKIILVQPGFQISKINQESSNVYKALVTVFDRIKSCEAEIEVWGNI